MIEALSYDVPLIAAQYADRFFKFLSDKGISKEVIQAHNPESKEIANHNYLSMNQLVPVLETAQSLLNDEKAAFEFGQQLDLFAHGLFGYALLSTDDYPQRIETIVKHLQISLPLFEMRFEQAGKDISIQLHDTWELGDARGFIAKVYFGSIYTIAASICENLKFDFDFGTELSGTDWETLAPDTLWHFNATNNEITLKQVKQLEKDESEKKVVTLRQQQ